MTEMSAAPQHCSASFLTAHPGMCVLLYPVCRSWNIACVRKRAVPRLTDLAGQGSALWCHDWLAGQGTAGLLTAAAGTQDTAAPVPSPCAANAPLREGSLGAQRSSAAVLAARAERRQQALPRIDTKRAAPAGDTISYIHPAQAAMHRSCMHAPPCIDLLSAVL